VIDTIFHPPCNGEFELLVPPLPMERKTVLPVKSIVKSLHAVREELYQAGIRCRFG